MGCRKILFILVEFLLIVLLLRPTTASLRSEVTQMVGTANPHMATDLDFEQPANYKPLITRKLAQNPPSGDIDRGHNPHTPGNG